jgi:hypothetical protein
MTEGETQVNRSIQNTIRSAIKAKAPIVALPIEGHAPFCLRAKLLRNALKNVSIHTVEIVKTPDSERFIPPELIYVPGSYSDGIHLCGRHVQPEGPPMHAVIPGKRRLKIQGKDGHVRTSCQFIPIPRPTALLELSKYADKEREKNKKKILLGDTAKGLSKAAKNYEFALNGDDTCAVYLRAANNTIFESRGVAIRLKAIPEYEFILHNEVKYESSPPDYRVSERSSGLLVSSGHSTVAKAIETAEMNFKKCSPEVTNRLKQRIAENKILAEMLA